MNEAFKREPREDLVWPTLNAANDPQDSDLDRLIDYRIKVPDAVPQIPPRKTTPIAAFPAQSDRILQPNQPSEAEEALADKLLGNLNLEIQTGGVTIDTIQNEIIDTEAVIAQINTSSYGKNLSRIRHQDGTGAGTPKMESILPGRPEDLKIVPTLEEVRRVQPGTPIQSGTTFTKPGELSAKVTSSKPGFLKRLFG